MRFRASIERSLGSPRSPLPCSPLGGSFAIAFLAATLCWAAEVPQPGGVETSSGSRVVSPAVVASWIAHTEHGGPSELELLVLWRGAPGWFMRSDSSGSSGSISGGWGSDEQDRGLWVDQLTYGGLHFGLEFDRRDHTARVQGQEVSLGSANVILIDDVDRASGPLVAGSLRVDPQLVDAAQIETVVQRSPELFDFLRCDAKLADSAEQAMMDSICARMKPR